MNDSTTAAVRSLNSTNKNEQSNSGMAMFQDVLVDDSNHRLEKRQSVPLQNAEDLCIMNPTDGQSTSPFPEQWTQFEDDEQALLASDNVVRNDRRLSEHSHQDLLSNAFVDDSDGDCHLLSASDSSTDDVEQDTPTNVTANRWIAFDRHSPAVSHSSGSNQLSFPEQNDAASGTKGLDWSIPPFEVAKPTPHSKSCDQHWLKLFTLHPKRERDYAEQFQSIFSSDIPSAQRLVSLPEVQQLFYTQFHVNRRTLEQIWQLADLDKDNRLNKVEFCLASHLSHLHGNKGLSIEDAMSATASYVARHMPNSNRHASFIRSEATCSNNIERPKQSFHKQVDGDVSRVPATFFYGRELSGDTPDNHPNPDPDTGYSLDSDGDDSSSSIYEDSSKSISSSSRDSASDLTRSSSSEWETRSEIEFTPLVQDFGTKASTNRSHKSTQRPNPSQVLAIACGCPVSQLDDLSHDARRKTMLAMVRKAKTANHAILRLNNEMQSEWAGLKEQHIKLSQQLQHLGLQPP